MSELVRGHVSIEVRRIGGQWLGLSRQRLWTDILKADEEFESDDFKCYSEYRVHFCLFMFSIHFPAPMRNAVRKLTGRDW